jgi:hypothetical protein
MRKVEALCVGAGIGPAARGRAPAWRTLLGDLRRVYGGPIVFTTGSTRELEMLPFAGIVDLLGLEIESTAAAAAGEILASWKEALEGAAATCRTVHARSGRRVVLTSVRLPSLPGGDRDQVVEAVESIRNRCAGQPWFAGLYVERIHSDPKRNRVASWGAAPLPPEARSALREWVRESTPERQR